MPLTKEQREEDRIKSAVNWNKNELAKRAADNNYIQSEFRRLELKAHRLKLNSYARWRKEVKRRQDESEKEKLLREEEIKVQNIVVCLYYIYFISKYTFTIARNG